MIVHNFVLCFYTKDLFLLRYQQVSPGENTWIITYFVYTHTGLETFCKGDYLFENTYTVHARHTRGVTEIPCVGVTFMYLVHKMV